MRGWHLVVLVVVLVVVLWIIHDDVRSTAFDYVSGVGSIASIYALILAFIEIKSAKRSAEDTKKAVEGKMLEINQLLTYADIEKHIQICSSVGQNLKGEQYEAVAMKIEELKKVLLEIKNNQGIKDKGCYRIQPMVMRLGTDITALRNKWESSSDLDTSKILEHIGEVSTFLQDISAKLKHQTI